ncbi:hypothetical protein [Alicyclobacillus dauci]|uniref:Uncharacterized protein n=1 Tax=Alicyclobacillus dauci TaxID=1475485 RepID=A0ABY6Z8G4_9BACL|nr:hypothetical protein [Alicyclobacillus dauci]WAH38823.1 hypothetical protein NZD86_10255 [Alicyclobacillus dauci]
MDTPVTGNNDTVNFEFQTFVSSDYQGHQINEAMPTRGYIVYNDRRKDFGFGAFGVSDSYTIDYDVLNQIRAKHGAFMDDIVRAGGFNLNGEWHDVDGNGEILKR